jgi:spore coat protein U-like protein
VNGSADNSFSFGDITGLVGQKANATASLTYVCNQVTKPQIALSDVNGSSTIGFQLKNTSAAAQNLLPFTIIQTGGATNFTDSNVAFQTANTNPISLTATIDVPPTLPAGAYTDVVTATLLP